MGCARGEYPRQLLAIVTDPMRGTLEPNPSSELGNKPEACFSETCGRAGPFKRLDMCSVLAHQSTAALTLNVLR